MNRTDPIVKALLEELTPSDIVRFRTFEDAMRASRTGGPNGRGWPSARVVEIHGRFVVQLDTPHGVMQLASPDGSERSIDKADFVHLR